MGIKITGTFEPSGDFGLIDDINVKGGHKSVATVAEMNAIPDLKRKTGMTVYVEETDKTYVLLADGTWQEKQDTSFITKHKNLITNDVVIKADENAISTGTVRVADGVKITTETGAYWKFI